MIEKPRMKESEAKENLKNAQFNFINDVKFLIHKTSVGPKLLQLKICVKKKQRERILEEFTPVISKITERIGLLFAGDNIVVPEELKKQVLDALHFGHLGSTTMLAESNIFWWNEERHRN